MNYAIVENGIVTNIVWLNPANAHKYQNAVKMHDIPAGIGDTYEDGNFYRDGKIVLSPLDEAETALRILMYGVE